MGAIQDFKIIDHENQIRLGSSWKSSIEFNSQNQVVEKSGHKYRLIRKERNLACYEQGLRKLLGVVFVILTLSLAFNTKFVDKLLHGKRIEKYFGIELRESSNWVNLENLNPGDLSQSRYPPRAFVPISWESHLRDLSKKGDEIINAKIKESEIKAQQNRQDLQQRIQAMKERFDLKEKS